MHAARDLFYARGVGATALDEVAAASGLTKPTLYRHFPSKEALIAAYLDDRHEQLEIELRGWIEAREPRMRPWAVIDWLCDWLSRPSFNGCAFVRTFAELQGDAGVRNKARRRKQALRSAIEDACRAAKIKNPEAVAGELVLIIEGATTMTFVGGSARPAIEAARSLAMQALRSAGLEKVDA